MYTRTLCLVQAAAPSPFAFPPPLVSYAPPTPDVFGITPIHSSPSSCPQTIRPRGTLTPHSRIVLSSHCTAGVLLSLPPVTSPPPTPSTAAGRGHQLVLCCDPAISVPTEPFCWVSEGALSAPAPSHPLAANPVHWTETPNPVALPSPPHRSVRVEKNKASVSHAPLPHSALALHTGGEQTGWVPPRPLT